MTVTASLYLAAAAPQSGSDNSIYYCLVFLGMTIFVPLGVRGLWRSFWRIVDYCKYRTPARPVEPDYNKPLPEARTHEELMRNAQAERDIRQANAAMRGIEASFDSDALCRRVQWAFEKLQAAISENKINEVQAFISDGVHERLLSHQAELMERGQRQRIDQIAISKTELREAAHEGPYEHAGIRIEGSMSRQIVGPNAAPVQAPVEKFTEVWTFLRQRGDNAPVKKGLIEGFCPSCGAPLAMNQHTRCEHCQALLRNGKFDWVLIEISHGETWMRARLADAIGADALQLRDPCFNIALLEDRVSVMFERWLTAHRIGRIEPLKKVATDRFCDEMLRPIREGHWYRDAVIDSVRTRGIVPGKEFDTALVEICWDASVVQRGDPPDARPQRNIVSRQLMVLKRRVGVKSEISDGFGAAHCPHCGAPESINPETACPSCGTGVNDGSLTWNVDNLVPMSSAMAQQYLELLRAVEADTDAVSCGRRQIGTPSATAPTRILMPRVAWRIELLAWAVELARADGKVTEEERLAILELGLRMGLSPQRIHVFLNAVSLQLESPKERGEMNLWLGELAKLSMIDGTISEKESAVLMRLAQRTGLNESEAHMALSKARLKQYESARIDLKSQWKQGRQS